jgi:hypothetical protein
MPLLQPVPKIVEAIERTRMIRLIYHDKERILEPHDHGILNGSVQLLGYQTAGSSSRPIPNWLLMKTDEISDLTVLDETFHFRRPAHSMGRPFYPGQTSRRTREGCRPLKSHLLSRSGRYASLLKMQ